MGQWGKGEEDKRERKIILSFSPFTSSPFILFPLLDDPFFSESCDLGSCQSREVGVDVFIVVPDGN